MAVGDPMIRREADGNERTSLDAPIDDPWARDHTAKSEDRDLRRIDDAGHRLRAAIADARDGNSG